MLGTRSSNRWVNLGVYHFAPGSDFQGVSLSNFTPDGEADDDIAWGSVAFAHTTLVALSIGGNDSRFSEFAPRAPPPTAPIPGTRMGDDSQPLAQAEPALVQLPGGERVPG